MARRTRSSPASVTRSPPQVTPPIQRILEEALNRKMTEQEKLYFHIARRKKGTRATEANSKS